MSGHSMVWVDARDDARRISKGTRLQYTARRISRWQGQIARDRRIHAGRLRWNIRLSAPDDPSAERWGDTAFARDLADAFARQGQSARIDFLGAQATAAWGDVVLVLRGLHRIDPEPGALNFLWIISHPDAVSADELHAGWDRVLAASLTWRHEAFAPIHPLLQAASTTRFHLGRPDPRMKEDVVFVGTSRRTVRPVIRDAIAAGANVGIYGHDWEDFVSREHIRADHLDFSRVPAAYRSARIVLNDHWDDMRKRGFVSNRLFDATFVGACVISDEIEGMGELFGGLVRTYKSQEELAHLLLDKDAWPSPAERSTIAERIRDEHSFDVRAAELVHMALNDLRTRGV